MKAGSKRTLAARVGIAILTGAFALAGCSMPKAVSGWFGGEPAPAEETALGEGHVYYASAAGLRVHGKPAAASPVVGELALHEKVIRYKVERGYAYIKAESGLTGWVDNAMLIWRVPGTRPVAAPEPVVEEPPVEEPSAAPEAPPTPTLPEPSPPPTATPATEGRPTPGEPGPGLFDPY
jgi:hypothetical protein